MSSQILKLKAENIPIKRSKFISLSLSAHNASAIAAIILMKPKKAYLIWLKY
jgi:hypothetical protein